MELSSTLRAITLSCLVASLAPLPAHTQSSFAGKLCVNKTTQALVVRARCKTTETALTSSTSLTGIQGPAGSNGSNGTNGSNGADGSLRIYGDGSAGALNVTTGYTTLFESNNQYTDCAISSGATLSVSSGTILRCTGSFTINGTLYVQNGSTGGIYNSVASTNVYTASLMPPHPGVARFAAGSGEIGAASAEVRGGRFGYNASNSDPASFVVFPRLGGGGGGASLGNGGAGGGALLVLVKGHITINGTISADALPGDSGGGGGGAGGVVFIASQSGVTLQAPGLISAIGADGGAASTGAAAGGGGAGGLVKIFSPSNNVDQSRVLKHGGSGGSIATLISNTVAFGGGAGGACLGGGGRGGNVPLGRPISSSAPVAGDDGFVVITSADPTSLF